MKDVNFSSNQQQELHLSMIENAEYQKAQNQEIKLGAEQGLDVCLYSNRVLNWLKMEQIGL